VPTQHPDDFEIIAGSSKPTKADENIAELQSRLQAEVDGRKEERFTLVFALAIALSALILPHMPWAVTVSLCLLELILLGHFATVCGVQSVIMPFERMFNRMIGWAPGKDETTKPPS